jgi:hypothetical protein
VDLSMRELCLSLGTSPSLGGGVSMPISPAVVVVVVVVVSVSTATVIRIIVSGRTMMVSLAVVLVLLVVSLVIAAVLAARHDEKTFLFQRGEMFLCDDHKENARKKRL